jgi:hypothetical protein
MAKLKVTKQKTGRRAAAVDVKFNRTYSATYRVVSETARIGPKQVLAVCPVAIGNHYIYGVKDDIDFEEDKGSWVNSISVEPESEDGKSWIIRVEYGPIDAAGGDTTDATLAKPQITWDYVGSEQIVDEDIEGRPVVNSAYDRFDPPLTREVKRPVLTIISQEEHFDFIEAFVYQDAINGNAFLAFGDEGLWRVTKYTGASTTKLDAKGNDVTVWNVTREWTFDRNGWIRPILNQGMRQLNQNRDGWAPILVRGQPISSPVLLDTTGHELPAGADPIYGFYLTYPVLDFSVFDLRGIDFGLGPF